MSEGHHGPTGALGIAGRLTRAFLASPLTPLILMASLAVGLIALASLPREEEPQISVPLVDIHVEAHGLRAEDAVKLVTEPLETIVKGIDQVEHVYSDTRDDAVRVTARFEVGVSAATAMSFSASAHLTANDLAFLVLAFPVVERVLGALGLALGGAGCGCHGRFGVERV